jgi:hypothetical protein
VRQCLTFKDTAKGCAVKVSTPQLRGIQGDHPADRSLVLITEVATLEAAEPQQVYASLNASRARRPRVTGKVG